MRNVIRITSFCFTLLILSACQTLPYKPLQPEPNCNQAVVELQFREPVDIYPESTAGEVVLLAAGLTGLLGGGIAVQLANEAEERRYARIQTLRQILDEENITGHIRANLKYRFEKLPWVEQLHFVNEQRIQGFVVLQSGDAVNYVVAATQVFELQSEVRGFERRTLIL